MHPYMQVHSLTQAEITKIHQAALTILEQAGFQVEHSRIREVYAAYGAKVDDHAQRVNFPSTLIEKFLADSKPYTIAGKEEKDDGTPVTCSECYRPINQKGKPYLATRAGISHGYYLDPDTNQPTPFSEETLKEYVYLSQKLDEDIIVRMETYPVGKGRITQPLECRLFAWKYGVFEGGSIQMSELMPYLYDMYVIRAEYLGLSIEDVFCASSYIISPLTMPKDFCEHVLYFYDRGLRVRIGNMFSTGGTGPVTLAGCLALGLAERLAISVLERCLYGDKSWVLYGEMAPLDMHTMLMLLGRPEILLFNLAVIQLARYYQAAAQTLGGVSDAALPSAEAGMQKVMTALPCILAGGCNIDPGRLGIDTLYSPIQMILDAELISSLRRLLDGFDVNDETLAVDLINEVGPGGSFMACKHTVDYMRRELWQSKLWSGGVSYSDSSPELESDVDRAYQRWREIIDTATFESQIDEQYERELLKIIDRAKTEVE
ncbi:MAG: trimethylamine methyltransferase family protein [Anaerolineales bacterium]